MTKDWLVGHGKRIDLGPKAVIMGILNVTPDSFSDGGEAQTVEQALARAEKMITEGAEIIDIGGESTRPGAEPVKPAEEQRRVLPVIEALTVRGAIISIDTYHEDTARLAVQAGAHIINDVWGLQREAGIARVAAATGAGLAILHTGRDRYKLSDIIEDQFGFLRRSLTIARAAGVEDERIVLDPGFGFAKDQDECLELMARFAELSGLGFPILAGTSRKRFLGHVTGREARDRDIVTAVSSAILRLGGASIFRVHNVAANVDALKLADAVIAHSRKEIVT